MTDDAWRTLPIVRVCARGHAAVTYLATRGQPEPLCPACAVRGRPIAPPQTEPSARPEGPWDRNYDNTTGEKR
jgi:hypothetical protein